MKKGINQKVITFICLVLARTVMLTAQDSFDSKTKIEVLQSLARQFEEKFERAQGIAIRTAIQKGWQIREELPDGSVIEIQGLNPDGKPIYHITHNLNAASTISTDNVWTGGSAGLSLSGSGMTAGEWDGGGVLTTHQELTGRVTQVDGPIATHYHATHVAGTLIASGIDASANGMAYEASLDAYDWNNDDSEMSSAASAGLLASNHSYGFIHGWYYNSDNGYWYWYGDISVSTTEEYWFGFYSSYSQNWDDIAFNAPYYLIVKSAGNDRNDAGPGAGGGHWVWNAGWTWSTATRDPDGGSDGYDCIGTKASAKNLLTVGAVYDIPAGYSQPSDVVMSSFSCWGPTDDGRIKPDIVGNGISLYSCDDDHNSDYRLLSGTSMSSPNVSGSLILLQQHYQNLHSGSSMLAATLKGLVIHTADEAGSADGPDYQFGWGLMNTDSAAAVLSDESDGWDDKLIQELTLNNGSSYSVELYSDGSAPLWATICWTDPAGTPPSPSLNPTTKMLVNDLDLRITGNSTTYFPWVLDPANPGSAATTADNNSDNVEQVQIVSPTAGVYTVSIDHKGTLQTGSQDFSLIVSGGKVQITPDVKAFLEGPFSSGTMTTTLTDSGHVALIQPYNTSPWNYNGTESMISMPADVVDWLLVELRTGTSPSTTAGMRAGLLKSDGTIVDTTATTPLVFPGLSPGAYYIVIHPRNHLSVMSAGLEYLNIASKYDFSTGTDKFYGGDAKDLGGGIYGIWSGDSDGSGTVDATDRDNIWIDRNGIGYYNTDINLDGIVDASDRSLGWNNRDKTTSLP